MHIVEHLGHCKGGTFNIHIWVCQCDSAILSCKKGNQVLFIIGKELLSCLSRENERFFMKIVTIYTLNSHLLTLKSQLTKSCLLSSSAEMF